ncbi:MAG: SDR family oxidoreductase [Firmicutes bacterium]|nr:SDR family oxidoreductase [Bacillota bacterium]
MSKRKFSVYGKNVIVTGASGGLGKEMVKLLITKYKCRVIGVARNESKMKELSSELGELSDKFSYRLFDVSDSEKWREFAENTVSDGFDADIIINNAGILPQFTRFGKYSSEQVAEGFNTNLNSVINSTQAFLPMLKVKKGTAIINISSSDALCPLAGTSVYSASKAAVKALSECMREEYRGKIYIPLVCPGFIRTDIMKKQAHNNNSIIDMVSMPASKAAKKILKRANSRRSRIVIGADAHFMSVAYRIAPIASQRFMNFIFRISKLELFSEIYD